nr:hypothetical protein [Lysinibacillus timonensis]
MAILNPQFAFLEEDYVNPNLNEDYDEDNYLSEYSTEQSHLARFHWDSISTRLRLNLLRVNGLATTIPAEIYSASIFFLSTKI